MSDLTNRLDEIEARAKAEEYRCPACGASAHACDGGHTDGDGPRLHCRESSLHNFPAPASSDLGALVAALRAVLDLHSPVRAKWQWCPACVDPATRYEAHTPYPCPTVRAITTALGVQP